MMAIPPISPGNQALAHAISRASTPRLDELASPFPVRNPSSPFALLAEIFLETRNSLRLPIHLVHDISNNYTLRLMRLEPLMHKVYQTQIFILDTGLRTYSVRARTLCVQEYQAQPEGISKHWAQWREMSVEPKESLTRLELSNTTRYDSFYLEIPQEDI